VRSILTLLREDQGLREEYGRTGPMALRSIAPARHREPSRHRKASTEADGRSGEAGGFEERFAPEKWLSPQLNLKRI